MSKKYKFKYVDGDPFDTNEVTQVFAPNSYNSAQPPSSNNNYIQSTKLSRNETDARQRNQSNENVTNQPCQPIDYNCRDVFEHINDCPVCSSLIKNQKRSYLMIIAILLFALLLMFLSNQRRLLSKRL